MIDVTDTSYWNERFEKRRGHKVSLGNRIIMVGLILFGIFTIINIALIYTFFNLLNKF